MTPERECGVGRCQLPETNMAAKDAIDDIFSRLSPFLRIEQVMTSLRLF